MGAEINRVLGIEFITILFQFYVLGFWSQGMWDLGSLTGTEP